MDFIIFIYFFPFIMIFTLYFSLIIDFIIGDPQFKYHPVMIIGKLIEWMKSTLRKNRPKIDRLIGIFLLNIVIFLICTSVFLLQIIIWRIWNMWKPVNWNSPTFLDILIYCALMGFILKWSFALKNLGDVTIPIGKLLEKNDIEQARSELSLIVRRDTNSLNEKLIISATVECIAESSTDAITSIIWFFFMGNLIGVIIFNYVFNNIFLLFLGIPFAYAFRVINTADSIVGYKDPEHFNIGWFSARVDDFANYIPTRLTVLFMLIAGKILKNDVKSSWNVLKSDRNKTKSVNAGWTMGTMAGLLNVQLEKPGNYILGMPNRDLEPKDINKAYQIIKLTVILYIIFLSSIIFIIIFLLIMV